MDSDTYVTRVTSEESFFTIDQFVDVYPQFVLDFFVVSGRLARFDVELRSIGRLQVEGHEDTAQVGA